MDAEKTEEVKVQQLTELLKEAIVLIEDDWYGANVDSAGQVWLKKAKSAI